MREKDHVMDVTTSQSVNDGAILGSKRMNKGIHWEWRVFGILSPEHRSHIERICSTALESSDVTDKYLWSTNCKANIKIRRKTLKFKHLLKTTSDGFELWEEGRHLKYKFPLDRSAIDMLENDLCLKAPDIVRPEYNNIDDLIDWISLFKPAIKCIKIRKHRSRCALSFDNVSIQLEIADILSPIKLTSIAIECNSFEQSDKDRGLYYMRGARDLLELPDSLRIMGYVQFLDDLVKQGLF